MRLPSHSAPCRVRHCSRSHHISDVAQWALSACVARRCASSCEDSVAVLPRCAASAAPQRSSGQSWCAHHACPDIAGRVTLELYEALTAIQQERAVDDLGWVVPIA